MFGKNQQVWHINHHLHDQGALTDGTIGKYINEKQKGGTFNYKYKIMSISTFLALLLNFTQLPLF